MVVRREIIAKFIILFPLKSLKGATTINLNDLAILCSNCHRVVHMRYPPYELKEVRDMLENLRRQRCGNNS
jgi:predicted HNH restriction endonuclease